MSMPTRRLLSVPLIFLGLGSCGGSSPTGPTNQTAPSQFTESGPFPAHSTGCAEFTSAQGPVTASVDPVLGNVALSTGGCAAPATAVLGQSTPGYATVPSMPGGLNRVTFSNDSDTSTSFNLRVTYMY